MELKELKSSSTGEAMTTYRPYADTYAHKINMPPLEIVWHFSKSGVTARILGQRLLHNASLTSQYYAHPAAFMERTSHAEANGVR